MSTSHPEHPGQTSPMGHHALMQAPVKPMDVHGVAVAGFGTTAFALATLLMWWQRTAWLQGRGWWLWVGVAGTVLGVVGVMYSRWRSRRSAT